MPGPEFRQRRRRGSNGWITGWRCAAARPGTAAVLWRRIFSTPTDPRTELVKSYGIQAYACQPLLIGGKLLGTLSFGTRKKAHFNEDELGLMQAVADQVAVAMERHNLRKSFI